MRARNIKPSFFDNEFLAELPFATRLCFIGLWTMADREGRLKDSPKRIKAALFGYDKVNVEKMLQQLADSPEHFIVRYESGGVRYIAIPNFGKHQNPHMKEPASTIPAPGEHSASTIPDTGQAPEENSSGPADSGFRIPDSGSLIPDSGREGERQVGSTAPMNGPESPPVGSDLFEWSKREFRGPIEDTAWREFGRYVNTPEAVAQWCANMPLWMQTPRYRDGFHGFNAFAKSGVWKSPPKPEVLHPPSRAPAKRETRTERLIRKAEAEEAKRAQPK